MRPNSSRRNYYRRRHTLNISNRKCRMKTILTSWRTPSTKLLSTPIHTRRSQAITRIGTKIWPWWTNNFWIKSMNFTINWGKSTQTKSRNYRIVLSNSIQDSFNPRLRINPAKARSPRITSLSRMIPNSLKKSCSKPRAISESSKRKTGNSKQESRRLNHSCKL